MCAKLINVQDDIRLLVGKDSLASELADALNSMFTITYYRQSRNFGSMYTTIYCKPTQTIAESLLIDREVLGVIANFEDLHVRTLTVAQEMISASYGRLDPRIVIVLHADKRGDERLRSWGREHGIKVIPIFRAKGKAIPPAEILKRNIAQELFASDPFQVTGPVINDIDFFGRGNESIELLRQLEAGRIRSIFGIRKIGKTSLINRVIKLAQDVGSPRIAMIDCSVREFNKLDAGGALRALAKVSKMAATRGYAHITDALKRTDQELVPVFDDLWGQSNPPTLVIIFDEVDYITPASPIAPHWRTDFNDFWREFRVLVQEAQRHQMTISVLVSGVSSQFFRAEQISGIENSVLHFVPEEYLAPFARGASLSMIRDLGNRCGLHFTSEARELIAEACGDFPFWVRMLGSHIHRSLDIESRPFLVTREVIQPLIDEFSNAEGAEIARVALEYLQRIYPEVVEQLRRCASDGRLGYSDGRLIGRYGLSSQSFGSFVVSSAMIKEGLKLLRMPHQSIQLPQLESTPNLQLQLSDSEWAEELALINRRRNILERRLREFIRFALKLSSGKDESWLDKILKALPEKRRTELLSLAADTVMNKLYWSEMENIIIKYWSTFEQTFGDKARFQLSMKILNQRPDAHAKPVDLADIALQRNHLDWLEERVTS